MHADHPLLVPINRRFGTWRGLVRTMLAQGRQAVGGLREFKLRQPEGVRRVVFVCRGNICRSSFAHRLAVAYGLPAASLGLQTKTGARSPKAAVEAAARAGIDMDVHRATDWKDFEVKPGDLFLVMEPGQAYEVSARLQGRQDVSISLLGMWCPLSMPHLHDPYCLSAEYFDTVFMRIDQAVCALVRELRRSAQVARKDEPQPA